MDEVGVQANVVSYSAVIDACARVGNADGAEKWLAKMLSVGVEANTQSYSAVINACAKANNPERAESWLKKMAAAGLEVDVVSYSAVIDACGRSNNAEKASEVFQAMLDKGIKPSIVTWTSYARPFARRGDVATVEKIMNQMRNEGNKINEYFLNVILVACGSCKPKQARKAEDLFVLSLSDGCNINEYVVTSLEKVVGRERAKALLEENGVASKVQSMPNSSSNGARRACRVDTRYHRS